jgi:3-hydroxyisobutyrate dehydrogenase-like beta-hydroxyacid dehydrogenase
VVERRFDDAFRLALMLKDVGIANRLADEQGLGVPLSALSEQLWRAASAASGRPRASSTWCAGTSARRGWS